MTRTAALILSAALAINASAQTNAVSDVKAAYHVGDRVEVVDGAGQQFVATVTGYDAKTNRVIAEIDGKPFAFPFKNILGQAGTWARFKTFLTEHPVVSGSGGVAALVGTVMAAQSTRIQEDDGTERTSIEEAKQMAADAASKAEIAALENGPSVAVRYAISGTFTAGQSIVSPNGSWQPSITFGGATAGFAGGEVVSSTAEPATIGGPAQVLFGGSWVQLTETEVSIKGTVAFYSGRAKISGGSLIIGGVTFSGGTIQTIARE